MGFVMLATKTEGQVSRINGQIPSKWISLKHTISPGRVLQQNGQNYTVEFEDINAKMWIPLVVTERLKIAAGASYRTEQIETKGNSNPEFKNVNHWNLRSAGVDLKTVAQLSGQNSLIVSSNFSYSATVQRLPLSSSPLNFTISAIFMERKSDDKEIGVGLMKSNTIDFLPVLPIMVWNQTFDKKNGIEISLPYKMAWRYNLSERNIFHLKAEGTSRSYFIDEPEAHRCRRVDVDLGIAYTRLINRWVGFEFFGGFRQNISNRLINDTSVKTNSGFAFSSELFVIPAFVRSKK
jgi:hypothetical protein